MHNGERENKPIPPEIQQAQQLRSQVAQIDKSDKSNGTDINIFMRKYRILMQFVETVKETTLNDLGKKRDELFKRKRTPEFDKKLDLLDTLESTLLESEKITKTRLILEEKEKILKREWTPESSGQMVFLNREQLLQENPEITPDTANSTAHLVEAKRVLTMSEGLHREYLKTDSTATLLRSERLLGAGILLRAQAEFIHAQAFQKPSPVTGK